MSPKQPQPPLRDAYQLLVDCLDEETQRALYEQLTEQGHPCRVLTRLGGPQKAAKQIPVPSPSRGEG